MELLTIKMDKGLDDEINRSYEYACEKEPFKQGAEARLYKCVYLGRPAIVKQRFSKKYRHPVLDENLTKERFRSELRALCRCKMLGVDVPAVYFVDCERNMFIMERIKDEISAKDFIESVRELSGFKEIVSSLGNLLGSLIAKIHLEGIMHGDLTTSNMLLRSGDPNRLILIDFGLSERNATVEAKGVDLYVLERAIISTHVDADFFFDAVLDGYRKHDDKQFKAVFRKLEEIRLRGRKRELMG